MHFNKLSSILLGSQIITAASYSYTRMDHKTMTGQFVMEIYVSKFLQLHLSAFHQALGNSPIDVSSWLPPRVHLCSVLTFLSYNLTGWMDGWMGKQQR